MPKVLLVEDDAVVRGALVRSLTKADHVVRAVGTALDALREVTADRPDLVILDLGLPDLDGADALRMLRGLCEVPVIVATARDDEAEIVKLLNAGADDYLTKPFSGEHLAARMSAVLRRAPSRRRPAVRDRGRGAPGRPGAARGRPSTARRWSCPAASSTCSPTSRPGRTGW